MTTSQKQFKNLLAWEAFLHTARTGNITLTAQVLNIDGSAVSRLIKGLEEELEQPLFDRSSRPFSLTPRGKRLREEVEPLVTGFEALISRRFEEPKQIIRVSAPADLSRDIIPEQLMNYTIEHPNVQFELSSLGSASEVLAGTVDAALTQHRPSNNANLTLRPCITASSPVLATPEYIARAGLPRSSADLRYHTGLLQKSRLHPVTSILYSGGEPSELLRWKNVFIANDQYSLKHVLLRGYGITIDLCPQFVVDELDSGRCIPILDDWARPAWDLCIVTRSDQESSNPTLRHFAQWWANEEMVGSMSRVMAGRRALERALMRSGASLDKTLRTEKD